MKRACRWCDGLIHRPAMRWVHVATGRRNCSQWADRTAEPAARVGVR